MYLYYAMVRTGVMQMKKVRYTVDFPSPIMELLNNMASDLHTSKSEIIKQALALYSYVNKEVGDDRHLSITKGEEIIKEIVLLNS